MGPLCTFKITEWLGKIQMLRNPCIQPRNLTLPLVKGNQNVGKPWGGTLNLRILALLNFHSVLVPSSQLQSYLTHPVFPFLRAPPSLPFLAVTLLCISQWPAPCFPGLWAGAKPWCVLNTASRCSLIPYHPTLTFLVLRCLDLVTLLGKSSGNYLLITL